MVAPIAEGQPRTQTRFRVVLILGSFDSVTGPILASLKSALASGLMSDDLVSLALVIDDVEVYKIDLPDSQDAISLIAERFDSSVSIFVIRNGRLEDAVDVRVTWENVDRAATDFARTQLGGTVLKLPILEKVSALATVMSCAFLIRHVELTRGGEYIELAYLIGSDRATSAKIWFFKREGVEISQMAWEILDKFGVQMRPYVDEKHLLNEALRLARYQAIRGPGVA